MVSVFVITYNSASYIKETLDSVKRQTYKNLELVISDDCSTDNTVEICRAWIEENRENFVRTELVSTPHNMGVAGNCNNAIRATTGVWLKGLSGDDKFLDYTIEEYVNYVNEHPECRICFAKLHFWGEDDEYVSISRRKYENQYYRYIQKDLRSQYKEILRRLFVPGPGLFFQKVLWEEIDGFDERYPFCEEYPFTYKVISQGNRIYFLDKELYGYQIRNDSLCREDGRDHMDKRVFYDYYRYFKEYRKKLLIKNGLLLTAYHQTLSLYYTSLTYISSNPFKICIAKYLMLLSPLYYSGLLKNRK